jgi:hypothetical protein
METKARISMQAKKKNGLGWLRKIWVRKNDVHELDTNFHM